MYIVCRCCSLAEEVKSLRKEREGDSMEREREVGRLRNQLQEATKVGFCI